jgi:ATP-dependent DNA ligase
MPFISPMLAFPLPEDVAYHFHQWQWVAEVKYDGHRIVIEKDSRRSTLLDDVTVRAWSRHGRDRILPGHLREAIALLPDGVYDGELIVQGVNHSGVTDLNNVDKLEFVMFDVMHCMGTDCTDLGYTDRRNVLEAAYDHVTAAYDADRPLPLGISLPLPIESLEDAQALCRSMWEKGEEGLILKRTDSLYQVGKRSKAWIKLKKLQSAECTVIGFKRGKLGPCSIICLLDDAGVETTVKVRNNEEMVKIEVDPDKYIGRQLRIEYQDKHPDGTYRHPRMDHWVEE